MYTTNILLAASLASIALAKTDLSGCTSTDVSSPAGASIAWYVPGTGELCEFLDCGGGRAPPKTTVPGCAAYSGTLTYSPSFLAGYGSATATASPSSSAEATTTEAATTESTTESTSSETSSDTPTYASSTSPASSIVETTTSVTSSTVSPSTIATSTITSAPVAPASGNGTVSSPNGSNGTVTNGSPSASPSTFDSGAMDAARGWVGGAGVMAFAAVIAAL